MADPTASSSTTDELTKAQVGNVTAKLDSTQIEPKEISKNAQKKADKQAKLAAEKANKSATSGVKEAGKAGAKKAVNKPTKKKEGDPLISINASKEDDFSGWYQQVLTKGEMLDYYDVSGCYILKVVYHPRVRGHS